MLTISHRHHPSGVKQRGVGLIEVLVTVLVTSVGLLGIAALHLSSLRNNFDANSRSYASMLASDIADRMRGNRTAALNGDYNVSYGGVPSTAGMAQTDVNAWRASLTQALPSGDGTITVNNATNIATIVIRWDERSTGPITFRTLTEI